MRKIKKKKKGFLNSFMQLKSFVKILNFLFGIYFYFVFKKIGVCIFILKILLRSFFSLLI